MSTANLYPPHSLGAAVNTLGGRWGWIVALGVVYMICGFIALGSVVLATVVSVTLIGVMMLLSGVFEIISAFQMKSWGRFFVWILLGVLYAVAGVLAFVDPLLVAGVLTLMLGAALVATGIVRIVLAFQMKGGAPWAWIAISGLITTLLGAIILIHWPVSSLYVLGIFLGVDLMFAGASWISLGLMLRRRRSTEQATPSA
jgi:uncharacterized membrane protein HdeD (DUF308 family)